MTEKKLSKKTLVKSWRDWMMFNLSSMSYERLESFGFCHSMLPVIEELYGGDEKEERKHWQDNQRFIIPNRSWGQ